MEVASRILLKQSKSGKPINQKCIYFFKTYQQTVITLVKCPGLMHFYKQVPKLKQHWASPGSQQHDFI